MRISWRFISATNNFSVVKGIYGSGVRKQEEDIWMKISVLLHPLNNIEITN